MFNYVCIDYNYVVVYRILYDMIHAIFHFDVKQSYYDLTIFYGNKKQSILTLFRLNHFSIWLNLNDKLIGIILICFEYLLKEN